MQSDTYLCKAISWHLALPSLQVGVLFAAFGCEFEYFFSKSDMINIMDNNISTNLSER